jgi:hypothetical protein
MSLANDMKASRRQLFGHSAVACNSLLPAPLSDHRSAAFGIALGRRLSGRIVGSELSAGESGTLGLARPSQATLRLICRRRVAAYR